MKKELNFILLTLLVVVLFGCENDSVKGNGKATELNVQEVKAFFHDKKTGFLYVKSQYEDRKVEDEFNLKQIERIAKEENIDFYVFNGETYNNDLSELGVTQYSRTFAFYNKGKESSVLDFMDLSDEQKISEIEMFIDDVKAEHFE